MTLVKGAIATIAIVALTACAGMMSGGKKVDVRLSGSEEVPPVATSASGSGSFTIGDDGSVSGSVTTTGVQGTAAHIHQGPKGQNGPVIIPLTKSGDTYTVPAGAKLDDAQMSAFKAGNLYVNVHSDQNKGGEVRAQLQPGARAGYSY
ncbi:MAG TPA: CHRD domain-containing protein [Burkholderiaceae bacterium]|nr:CHRD domain-containing protein [Burkholderiaceae bacterium]